MGQDWTVCVMRLDKYSRKSQHLELCLSKTQLLTAIAIFIYLAEGGEDLVVDLVATPLSGWTFTEKPDLVRRDRPTAMLASFVLK